MPSNIGAYLDDHATLRPKAQALVFPKTKGLFKSKQKYSSLTFSQLQQRSNQYAHQLARYHVEKGSKVVLFIRPSLDFPAIVFALFKLGAIPVLIDPGMGLKRLLAAVEETGPDFLIAEPIVHYLRLIYKNKFSSLKNAFSLKRVIAGKAINLKKDLDQRPKNFTPEVLSIDDTAAILFTSGGTGRPKGVVYTQGIFHFQIKSLKTMFNLSSEDIDLPGFPLFALFSLAIGMKVIIPNMNPARPSSVNPKFIAQNIVDHSITFAAGSPAIWKKVGAYCQENNITFPSLKYLVMFGAPVSLEMHDTFKDVLINGDTFTPYGATECLPISLTNGLEIREKYRDKMNSGEGTYIGSIIEGVRVKIIKAHNDVISTINDIDELKAYQRGEIIVSGPNTTGSYHRLKTETQKAKIYDGNNVWHRMGDMGYFDKDGGLWFLGRVAHVVALQHKTLYPIGIESIFYARAKTKTALINLGDGRAGIVIEGKKNNLILEKLKTIAADNEQTKDIDDFYFIHKFPVDIRHNIKIDRQALSQMAKQGLL